MAEAHQVAQNSKDRRKVGCIIISENGHILSQGCNMLPNGVKEESKKYEAPEKYYWIEHAERNAIFAAAKEGIRLLNSTMYLTWFPCVGCARAIAQSGISKLVARPPDFADQRWGHEFEKALEILKESKVEIQWYKAREGTQMLEPKVSIFPTQKEGQG
jgi:dCMP deaminase